MPEAPAQAIKQTRDNPTTVRFRPRQSENKLLTIISVLNLTAFAEAGRSTIIGLISTVQFRPHEIREGFANKKT